MARAAKGGDGKKATRIKAGTLVAVLDDVADLVPTKNTIPILNHVLIEAGHERLAVTATDLDAEARRSCTTDDRDGPNSAEWLASVVPFAAVVPAAPLHKLAKEFDKDAMVTLALDEDANRLTVSAGRARFKLATLPPADFPRWTGSRSDADADFSLPCGVLADALAQTGFAVSTEETRYYINGVYIHPEGLDLRFAATDGARLSRVRMDGPDGAASMPPLILPRQVIKPLDKLLGHAMKAVGEEGMPAAAEIEVGGEGKWIAFDIDMGDAGRVTLSTKGIDGTFPDYARVIPSDPPLRAIVKREELAEAIKRVLAIAGKGRLVKVDLAHDLMTLTVTAADAGHQASEEVPCVYDGEALTLGLNGAYWREALGAIGADEVAMRLTDTSAPIRIEAHASDDEEGRLVQVVMPHAI
ncbi:UNVERIFIED_ORG: DNA polymerase-3 subunit beta [Sphingomonas sp. R1F5B]